MPEEGESVSDGGEEDGADEQFAPSVAGEGEHEAEAIGGGWGLSNGRLAHWVGAGYHTGGNEMTGRFGRRAIFAVHSCCIM